VVSLLKFYIKQVSDNPYLIREVNRGTVIFNDKNAGLRALNYEGLHPSTFLPTELKDVKDLERNRRVWLIYSEIDHGVIDGLVKIGFKESRRENFEGGVLRLFTN